MQNLRGKKNKRKIKCFILLTIFLSEVCYLYYSSNKILMKTAAAMYEGVLTNASYCAINDSLDSVESFSDLINVEYKSSGDVSAIFLNSYKFNYITNNIADKVYSYLKEFIKKGIPIHIGAFTGINMFSGVGKTFNMPLISVSSVKCEIISEFTSQGINQTRHALYVSVVPNVYVVTRFKTDKLEDSVKLLVYDNLICGSVPNFYMAGGVYTAEIKAK